MSSPQGSDRSNSFEDAENEPLKSVDTLDDEGLGASSDGRTAQESALPEKSNGEGPKTSQRTSTTAENQSTNQSETAKEKGAEPEIGVGTATAPSSDETTPLAETNGDRSSPEPESDAPVVVPSPSESSDAPVMVEATPSGRSGCCARCCSRMTPLSWALCMGGVLLTLVALLLVTHFVIFPLFTAKVHKALIPEPGQEDWIRPPATMFMNLYFFNVKNPEGFLSRSEVPHLQEKGPYAYSFDLEKINATWNDNDTVSYREHYDFWFNLTHSNGSEEDAIRTANIPLLTMYNYLGMLSGLLDGLLPEEAKQQIEDHTVRDMVWGYRSLVLQAVHDKAEFLHLAKHFPTTFGIFASEGSQTSKVYNVYTGKKNFSRLNDIYSWDYQRRLPWWATDAAKEIKGTEGSVFKPDLDKNSDLTVFVAPLFRSFKLNYEKLTSYKGLQTLRFVIPDSAFSNHTAATTSASSSSTAAVATSAIYSVKHSASMPAHTEGSEGDDDDDDDGYDEFISATSKMEKRESGFCVPSCVPSGAYSIEPCTNAPLYISLPHFLGADPVYRSEVSGLDPREDRHRPVWDIDPITGVTVYHRRRFQINVKMDAGTSEHTYLPVMWVDMDARINSSALGLLRRVSAAKVALAITACALLSGITALFLVTIWCIVCTVWKAPRRRAYHRIDTRGRASRNFVLCLACESGIEEAEPDTGSA